MASQTVNPSLLTRLPCAAHGVGFAFVVLLALPAALASTPACTKADPRDPDYQRRTEMDRCEGISRTNAIGADGLRLTSYTIGQASPQKGPRGGNVFTLQIPVSPPGLPEPAVAVVAWKGNYRMEPLRLAAANQGWKEFSWGAAVIQGQGIPYGQLRATALLKPSGDANQWLPVRFAPASSYNLVITSNTSLPIATVRILRSDYKVVAECPSRPRMDQDLLCTWKAADLPAGTYLLRARAEDGRTVLNETLRHDPRWLRS